MCTSLRIRATDGTPVTGRTMEFPVLLDATLSVIPRGIQLTSATSAGAPGATWTTVHGVVGVNAFPAMAVEGPIGLTDGLNEKGMYGGLLYMPGFCEYGDASGVPANQELIATHVIAYVLSTCATVTEARDALTRVHVVNWSGSPVSLDVHFRFDDAAGNGIVVEWQSGAMTIHDNPIGVMTNAPYFDWHLTNLRNYVNLNPVNPAGVTLNGVALAPLGAGEGMRGIPGDATPPGRFVRAAAYVATADASADGAAAEMSMMHMLNNFDLLPGFAKASANTQEQDQTLWSTIANLTEATYSLRTHGDVCFRKITLADVDFTGEQVQTHSLPGASTFPTLTL